MNILKVNMQRNALRAMAHLMPAKPDIRYYLNGIKVEIGPEEARLVATDGHKLGVLRLDQAGTVEGWPANLGGAVEVIVPAAIVKGIKSAGGRRASHLGVTLELELDAPGGMRCALRDHQAGTCVAFAPVDGTFPDYRRVMPREAASGIAAQFNPALLADFEACGVELAGKARALQTIVAHNGPEKVAFVTFACEPARFAGLVMPYRVSKADVQDLPLEWVRESIGAAAPVAELEQRAA